jgi:hypothetical protein
MTETPTKYRTLVGGLAVSLPVWSLVQNPACVAADVVPRSPLRIAPLPESQPNLELKSHRRRVPESPKTHEDAMLMKTSKVKANSTPQSSDHQ